jgi:hypothetical protein
MFVNVLAIAAAVVDGVTVVPSPPPTTITATVFRHRESAAINRDASVRTSLNMFASGASTVLELPLPAGNTAPDAVNARLRIVEISVFGEDASALTRGVPAGADPLLASTVARVSFHRPGPLPSVGNDCPASSSCTSPSFSGDGMRGLTCRMAIRPNRVDFVFSAMAWSTPALATPSRVFA